MNPYPPTSAATGAAESIGIGEVHTYRGRTLQELIPQIKAELGSGAIILREREGLTGGVGGFFAQRCVEIDAQASPRVSVYADDFDDELKEELRETDERPDETDERPDETDEATFAARLEQAALAQPEEPAFIAFDEMARSEPAARTEPTVAPGPEPASPFVAVPLRIPVPVAIDVPPVTPPVPPGTSPVPPAAPPPQVLKRRRGGLAERVIRAAQAARAAAAQLQAPAPVVVPHPPVAAEPPVLTPAPLPRPSGRTRPAPTEELQRRLLDAGLTRIRAHELIAAALEITDDDELLTHAVRHELIARLPTPSPLPAGGGVIALVGPGGSGKTRCVAALAIACAGTSSRPVSVAHLGKPARATELAELVRGENVSVIPSMRTHATVRAVGSARERGLVILDTPAASPGEPSSVEVLGDALAQFEPDGVYLTVPATFTARAAARLTEGFAPLGLEGLVATHVDEADQLGVVTELSMQTGLPLSHSYAGVDVPMSLAPMDPEQLAEVVLP
jgi:flagellar biosynthesis GTPase FlhF